MRPHQIVEDALARVSKRRMAEVMRQRDGFSQIAIQPESSGHRARHLRGLDRVRQPGAIVVALVVDENLGLVLEPAERSRMNDAISIALKRRSHPMRRLVEAPSARVAREHCVGRKGARFDLFEVLSGAQHFNVSPSTSNLSRISMAPELLSQAVFTVTGGGAFNLLIAASSTSLQAV
jgi:hypothetical protein